MKLRKEIEPNIKLAEKNYSLIVKAISDYTNLVDEKGDEDNTEFSKLVDYLSTLTSKIDIEENYCVWEYWEADGLERESYRLAIPNPVIIEDLTKDELMEIVTRIQTIELPDYLKTDFIQKNCFEWEIREYYYKFLALNLKKYRPQLFNRQKDDKGNWYEPTIEDIVDKLI